MMGVSKAQDIATEIMHDIFSDMDIVEFYMDDISCSSNSWEEHLGLLTICPAQTPNLVSLSLPISP